VFVTHDQQEALEVADAVVVLNRGRIEQRGTPQEVYDRPASAFVHRFVGASHELPAERREGRVSIGPLAAAAEAGPDARLTALVRPHDLELRRDGEGWPARVLGVRVLGPLVHVDLQADGLGEQPLVAELGRDRYDREPVQPGDAVRLAIRRYGLYPAQEVA
jgi:sulfate transport system ATP-binding protein